MSSRGTSSTRTSATKSSGTSRSHHRRGEEAEEESDPSKEWREWHPEMFAYDGTMLLIGPRGQGKTTFMLDVARKCKTKEGIVIVVCPTPEIFTTYGEHIPLSMCHHHFNNDLEAQLDEILAMQQSFRIRMHGQYMDEVRRVEAAALQFANEQWRMAEEALDEQAEREHWDQAMRERRKLRLKKAHDERQMELKAARHKELGKRNDELRRPYAWTGIWDDLAYNKACMNSETIGKSVRNGRHYIQQQLYAIQAVLDFRCDCRDQIDLLAMSPMVQLSNVKRFMEQYIPSGVNKNEFVEILQTFAEKGWWLVVNRRAKSLDPHDFIFRYRAEFEIVAKQYIASDLVLYMHSIYFDAEKAAKTQGAANDVAKSERASSSSSAAAGMGRSANKAGRTGRKTNASGRIETVLSNMGPENFNVVNEDEFDTEYRGFTNPDMAATRSSRLTGGRHSLRNANAREDDSLGGSGDDN